MKKELEKVAKEFEGYVGTISANTSSVTFEFTRGLTYEEQLALQEVVTPNNDENALTENVRCFTFPGETAKMAAVVVTF